MGPAVKAKVIITHKGNGYMTDLMSGALELMGVGMGFVFAFLIILVGVTTLMSRFITRYAPAAPVVPAKRRGQPQPRVLAKIDADTREAIRIAVSQHRARQR